MTDVRRDMLALLSAAAKRLLWRRVLESAAVPAVAAGLCAAALEVAWMFAAVRGQLAAAICVTVALVGPAAVAIRAFRRWAGLDAVQAALAAAVCAACGAGGLACVLGTWHAMVPKAAVWAVPVCGAAAVGVAV